MALHRRSDPTLLGCTIATVVGVVFWLAIAILSMWFPFGTVLALVIVVVAFVVGN